MTCAAQTQTHTSRTSSHSEMLMGGWGSTLVKPHINSYLRLQFGMGLHTLKRTHLSLEFWWDHKQAQTHTHGRTHTRHCLILEFWKFPTCCRVISMIYNPSHLLVSSPSCSPLTPPTVPSFSLFLSLSHSFSALHHAALTGTMELLSLLLEAQATVDIKDINGIMTQNSITS